MQILESNIITATIFGCKRRVTILFGCNMKSVASFCYNPSGAGGGAVVDVRTLAVDSVLPADWPLLEALLDQEERARARRFRFERDRRSFIAAHALLRRVLAAHGGRPAADWRFSAGPFGKPVALDPPPGRDIRFSLSHTDGMAAVAVAEGVEVGVDVEAVNDARAEPDVIIALLAAEEAAALPVDRAARRQRLFALWTLKEAFVKAVGRGLSQPLDSFAFAFDPVRLVRLDPALQPVARWRFIQWRPDERHVAALAVDAPDAESARPPPPAVAQRGDPDLWSGQ